MPPRPLSSTLFPYTTLFRSVGDLAEHLVESARLLADVDHGHDHRRKDAGFLQGRRNGLTARDRRADRKSTRLNSSHITISYAVFCLKKKNHVVASDVHHLTT